MAQRNPKKALTKEEKDRVALRIKAVRKELGFTIGDPITYELLAKVVLWVNSRVNYLNDLDNYGKPDFWNTLAFNWLMLDDYLDDDCDGSGYVYIAFCLYVLKMNVRNVYRVACKAETGEGHFVTWARASNNIIYQIENRMNVPRTLRYMHDLGYRYMQYSDMSPNNIKKDKLFNAENFVMKEIYKTPLSAQGNEPDVPVTSMVKATAKSKTLSFGVFDKALTTGGAILATLASQADWKVVALIGAYGILSLGIVYYIRSVTYEPLEFKK